MVSSEIFLIGFSVFAVFASIVVYKTDFRKWDNKHLHE